MNILTTTDNNRHNIERQTLLEKKQKNYQRKKKSIANTQNTLSFFFNARKANDKKNERVFSPTPNEISKYLSYIL